MRCCGVCICEDEIRETVSFETMAELQAYAGGFGDGAGHYGCGEAWVATRLEDLEDIENESDREKVRVILQGNPVP